MPSIDVLNSKREVVGSIQLSDELFGEVGGGPLGGETDFYKLRTSTAWYFPGLLEGHVIEVVGQAGVADECL